MQGEKPVHRDVVNAMGHLCRYNVDSDKENHEDALHILRVHQVAKRMGDGRGVGR